MADNNWFEALQEDDLAFLRRFLLASGSLKDLANDYGVSYPTIRLRLDRIIAKVQALEQSQQLSPFEKTIRLLIADGKIDPATASKLLDSYRSEQNAKKSGG